MSAPLVVLAALLAHQVGRIWERGFARLRHNYAPVFAVQLPSWLTALAQVAALPAAIACEVVASGPGGRAAVAALVVLWLASTQSRLANHAWLGAVAVLAMLISPTWLHPVIARDLLIGVYVTAAVFKLNADYLTSDRSAGRIISEVYLNRLGIPTPPWLLRTVPVVVIAVEAVLPATMTVPGWSWLGLALAIGMHLAFGVSGNFGFSIMAMALWVCALASDGAVVLPSLSRPAWLLVPVGLAVAMLLGRSTTSRRTRPHIVEDAVLGAVFGALAAVAITTARLPALPTDPTSVRVHLLCAVGFAANFLLVVAGLKLEWSFAMFSSLRPFGGSWLQRGGRRNWPRYFTLALPERIPSDFLREVEPAFLYRATRPEFVVHECVARHLEDLAKRCGFSLRPCPVVPESHEDGPTFVPTLADRRPRRTPLLFPALVPSSRMRHYLG